MPYSAKTELPAAVRELPEHAQTIWMAAFNAAFKQHKGDEQKAFAIAWAAANKHKKTNAPGRARREWNPDGVLIMKRFIAAISASIALFLAAPAFAAHPAHHAAPAHRAAHGHHGYAYGHHGYRPHAYGYRRAAPGVYGAPGTLCY